MAFGDHRVDTGATVRLVHGVVGLSLALLLAACGGGGGSSTDARDSLQKTGGGGTTPPNGPVGPTLPQALTAGEATRLLDQAAFGPTSTALSEVRDAGVSAWVESQLSATATGYPAIDYVDPNSAVGCPTGSVSTCFRDNYTPFPLQLVFFRNAMTGRDQLRQRVAFAYSQIFVISGIDIKETYGMRAYQQLLLDNAFGNYRTLLERVTLSPAMGDYLDMVNNDKPTASVQANENYAREVLQLFSIGLSKLNADGTVQTDANGVAVPSFDQSVVQGYARAFTGWTYAARPTVTSRWTNARNYLGDMVPFAAHHDVATKTVLDGRILPAGQTPQKDLADALDSIHNHPNVGTFIGRQLIQALVTSNPSPAYVARITAVFNDNGVGVRGDMQAVGQIAAHRLDRGLSANVGRLQLLLHPRRISLIQPVPGDEALNAERPGGSLAHRLVGFEQAGGEHFLQHAAEVRFVERHRMVDAVRQMPRRTVAEASEQRRPVGGIPPAPRREPDRRGKMVERHERPDAARMACGDHALVMIEHRDREFARRRLDPRPFQAEAIDSEPERLDEL